MASDFHENLYNARRIDSERASLKALPRHWNCDYKETIVRVSSSGGFALRRVFYTVPSGLIGHRLRVRLYDDRLALSLGEPLLLALPRRRAHPDGRTIRS